MLKNGTLSDDFRIERYVERYFKKRLSEIIEHSDWCSEKIND